MRDNFQKLTGARQSEISYLLSAALLVCFEKGEGDSSEVLMAFGMFLLMIEVH